MEKRLRLIGASLGLIVSTGCGGIGLDSYGIPVASEGDGVFGVEMQSGSNDTGEDTGYFFEIDDVATEHETPADTVTITIPGEETTELEGICAAPKGSCDDLRFLNTEDCFADNNYNFKGNMVVGENSTENDYEAAVDLQNHFIGDVLNIENIDILYDSQVVDASGWTENGHYFAIGIDNEAVRRSVGYRAISDIMPEGARGIIAVCGNDIGDGETFATVVAFGIDDDETSELIEEASGRDPLYGGAMILNSDNDLEAFPGKIYW